MIRPNLHEDCATCANGRSIQSSVGCGLLQYGEIACDICWNQYLGKGLIEAHFPEDLRPCQGGNTNICVAEGCYDEACIKGKDEKEVHLESKLTRIREILTKDCYVLRSPDVSCAMFIGGLFGREGKQTVWTEEMCCMPCRIRVVLDE